MKKIKEFITTMKDPGRRRYFCTYFGGKLLGIAMLYVLYKIGKSHFGIDTAWADEMPAMTGTAAAAAPAAAAAAAPAYLNPINTMWTLIAAFLVFFMQAGFMTLEAGFARS